MAAAEARAAWQRANRCFVQEDAKRAPKLACCPSSGASTKQIDSGPASATDGHEYRVPGFVPLNNNPSYTSVPPDTKWWLQLQPNYGSQRGSSNEQLDNLEAEMNICGAGFASLNIKSCQVHSKNVGALVTKNSNLEPSCATEKMDHVDSASFKTSDVSCFDSESPFSVSGKSDFWWKTADSVELASLVAQRSIDLVENCDLPQPQTIHMKRGFPQFQTTHMKRDLSQPQKKNLKSEAYACVESSDHARSIKLSGDLKPQSADLNIPTGHKSGSSTSGCAFSNGSVEGSSKYGIDKPISLVGARGSRYNATKIGQTESQISAKDPCKAQILEALRHSQTRAREAEMAAKQAYAEKEHVVKLIFRQASQLFVYKQWLQLLQLENFYYQIKSNKNHPLSSLLPEVLPWTPLKIKKICKKGNRSKQGRPGCNISQYTLMFALGMSLVGAGLFLGWTIGWMLLPAL
uniref:Uncharacterized protein n=1 Tax=Daucus carota subsp. sativus TaxID=79200 RepID=A0A166D0D8_DAUCS